MKANRIDLNNKITEAEDYYPYPKEKRYQPVNIHHMDEVAFHNLGVLDNGVDTYRWLNIGRTIDELNILDEEIKELESQMVRLYNYFCDYLSDEMEGNQFSEMWDMVKESEYWEF